MTSAARIEKHGSIAVLVIDNPPVHALSTAVKLGIVAGLDAVEHDSSVTGVVITTASKTFVAGADLKEMDRPLEPPFLPELLARIDAFPKPVAAALYGNVLGGGFELALACRLRVAAPGTKIGLPEVKVGLIPGSTGTQRLLRRVDFNTAVDVITSGKPMSAARALELGLIHQISSGDVRADTIAALERAVAENKVPASSASGVAALPGADVGTLEASVKKAARGALAPLHAFRLLVETAPLSYEDGCKKERELFVQLRSSFEARALRHSFAAERNAGRAPDLAGIAARNLSHVGVIGGGLMGCGIAFASLTSGYAVTVVEGSDAAMDAARGRMDALFASSLGSGRMTEAKATELRSRLAMTTDYAKLGDADLVIEAVFESMDVKRAVFTKLDEVTRPDAILASNTSYLDLDAIADITKNPARVVGIHFFSPAHIMRLVEVVRGAKTQKDIVATSVAFARKLGKVPVITGVCEGFCGNRILKYYRIAGEAMLEDGASPQDIDAAMNFYGFPMGPFAVQDLAGLEIAYANRKNNPAKRPDGRPLDLLERVVDAGRKGQKNAKGWYDYAPGARRGEPSDEVMALLAQARAEKGITPRSFSRDEIIEKMIGAMRNEARKLIAEGIVGSPDDVDLVLIHGYGFPAHKGGPMFEV